MTKPVPRVELPKEYCEQYVGQIFSINIYSSPFVKRGTFQLDNGRERLTFNYNNKEVE